MKASDAAQMSDAHQSMTEASVLYNRTLALIRAEALMGRRVLSNPFPGLRPAQIVSLETILISNGYTITTRVRDDDTGSCADLFKEISW